jgi:hypothetical protein
VVELRFQGVELLLQLRRELGVRLRRQQLVQYPDVLGLVDESLVSLEVVVQTRELGGQSLAAAGVVPDAGLEQLALQLLGTGSLAIDVKGTPSRWRRVGRRPGCGR